MHLVLLGVGKRLLCVLASSVRPHPGHQGVGEVAKRSCGFVPLLGGVGNGVRLEERRGLAMVHLDLRGADVHQCMRPRGFVAEPDRELERLLSPDERLLDVL